MTILVFFCLPQIFAQNEALINDDQPYIEVTGTAWKEVIPDEIYIGFTINEKYLNKDKVTIEQQEEKLIEVIKSLGIDLANLNLSDANADYIKVRIRRKDVLTKKEYLLKVGDAKMVSKVYEELEKLDILDASITKVNHSQIENLRKEARIMAIKAAKDKADYLLSAIGEQTGKALIVKELESGYNYEQYANVRGQRASGNVYYVDGVRVAGAQEEIQFEKIKVQASIYVKFAIK